MTTEVTKEVAALRQMTKGELRDRYAEVFSEATRSGNRGYLIKRIAWRLQSLAEGGLSERARRRAAELACDADIRVNAPMAVEIEASSDPARTRTGALRHPDDDRLPPIGTILTHRYKGREVQVTILANGFEYEGERYTSLSGAAKAITGTHINGFQFFQLGRWSR